MPETATAGWTCTRCEMTVSWMPEVEKPRLPATWARENGELYCLSCRRDIAGDVGVEGLAEDASNDERSKTRSRARIEFELQREPDRQDNRVAKSCNTSIAAVRKARDRLGMERPAES
jgi:uncharacterized protein YdaU (DUF1376 family)